jgi:2-dehydro-3-deoxyphosphooctonate aldolase (KDO 8-P synthase)
MDNKLQDFFGKELLLIAGPCVIESPEHVMMMAAELKKIAAEVGVKFVFKASYDKANRTAGDSFRGPGLKEGLRILKQVKEKLAVPLLSDVHDISQVAAAAEVLDIIQVPAFLSRQTDLVMEVARTGRVVNIKKGQFSAPEDMRNTIEKVYATGNKQVILTERGVFFGYHQLVVDMRSFPIMRSFGVPVVFDGTHSVQEPGGLGKSSGGNRRFVPDLCRAAVATGVDGLFLEVHDDPDHAKSDGPNMVELSKLKSMLLTLTKIHKVLQDEAR